MILIAAFIGALQFQSQAKTIPQPLHAYQSIKTELILVAFKPHDHSPDMSMVLKGWSPDCWMLCSKGVHYTLDPNPLTTNAGMTFLASKAEITGYANNGDYAQYIAVTTTAISPAYTDTTLSGEITTNGLARAIASCSVNAAASGSITATCSKTFTASGTFTAVQASGLFTQSVTGILYEEGTFSSVNMISGDTLTVSWVTTYNG